MKKDCNQKDKKQNARKYENESRKEVEYEDQVEGRNSVLELLESGKDINKIFIAKGEKHGSINKIIAIAKERKIITVTKDKRQMDTIATTTNYQGVIAIVPPYEYCEIEDILEAANDKNEDPFVLVLDGIEDPHNLGSTKRRAALVNSTVNKVSAGAVEHMKVARVTNISESIEKLKKQGIWVCGTDINTDKYYYNQDLTGPLAIVIGNEGKGISKKVLEKCDFLVKIPMRGKVTSLNASVSAGIIMYEVVKQRIK